MERTRERTERLRDEADNRRAMVTDLAAIQLAQHDSTTHVTPSVARYIYIFYIAH